MKARHGAQWLAYASRAAGGDPRGALDEYGLLKTMIDNWRDVFDEAFTARREEPGAQLRLDRAGGAQRHVAPVAPAARTTRRCAISTRSTSVLRAVKAPAAEIAEAKRLYEEQRQSGLAAPASGSDTGRLTSARAGADSGQAGQGAAAVDRSGAAAPRCARQPLQGVGVRRRSVRGRFRQRRGRLRDAARLLPDHLPDRGAEARPCLGACSGSPARAAIR